MSEAKRFMVGAAVAASALFLAARVQAGFSVWSGNGHSFEVVVDRASSWTQAEAAAQTAGGNLATITSAAEDNFIAGLLASSNAPTGSYRIGLHRTGGPGDGTFQQWITGEPLVYTNWTAGVPDNWDNVEVAGSILWTQTSTEPSFSRRGQWNDLPDSGFLSPTIGPPAEADLLRGGFVVEQDPQGSSIPLPRAALLFVPTAVLAILAVRRLRTVDRK